jgi:hypothetical protein
VRGVPGGMVRASACADVRVCCCWLSPPRALPVGSAGGGTPRGAAGPGPGSKVYHQPHPAALCSRRLLWPDMGRRPEAPDAH